MTPLYIAGPCVIETEEQCRTIANEIKRLNATLKTNIIFKASFDKANRTSFQSYRGPGIEAGLEILSNIKKSLGLNITTDIHETWQADKIAEVADVIQIPAFLCRQTDLIRAASETGKIVNIKKGQFMSGDDMKFAAEKARHFGCREVWLTERGNSFGYNNLIVDFRPGFITAQTTMRFLPGWKSRDFRCPQRTSGPTCAAADVGPCSHGEMG